MLKEFFDNALRDLHQFKGTKAKRNGQVELRDKWNKNPNAFKRNSDHFYEHEVGDSYLYDLAYWHASKTIYHWGQMVHKCARKRCWDFGGGIGTYSLLMASSPLVHVVYYDDINSENREFAQWRFKKHGVLDKIMFGAPCVKVDTIVALDVIEHLSDPQDQLIKFNLLSHPQSRMVVNVTAHTSNGEHPMHVMDAGAAEAWWRDLGCYWSKRRAGSPSEWEKKR